MKKIFAAVLAAALCLLCACSQQTARPYDIDDAQTLLDAGLFSEQLEQLDSSVACMLLGVDESKVDQCAAYLPTSVNSEALFLFVLSDGEAAGAVETSMRSWLTDQIDSFADYGPDQVPKLEGAVVSVRENTVLLLVGSDPTAAKTAVDGLDG